MVVNDMSVLGLIIAIIIIGVAHLYFSHKRNKILEKMHDDKKELINAVEKLGKVN